MPIWFKEYLFTLNNSQVLELLTFLTSKNSREEIITFLTHNENEVEWKIMERGVSDEYRYFPEHYTSRDVRIELIIDSGYPSNIITCRVTKNDK